MSIDEGSDFFLECFGDEPRWIVAKRFSLDAARVSTVFLRSSRKAVLVIQSMDQSLVGSYLCQTNQSVSTVVLQLTKRHRVLTKQIRFMGTNNNHSVTVGSDVRLNCFGQYYSEKAMDSPYIPQILWFFERKQIFEREGKFEIGADYLLIRNFTDRDRGVYFCRAFITLKNNFLTKTYPIFVEIQASNESTEENFPVAPVEKRFCPLNSSEIVESNRTTFFCTTDGEVSRIQCEENQVWSFEFSRCVSNRELSPSSFLEIFPNLDEIEIEPGRIYTFACRSKDENFLPQWSFENGTIIRENSTSNELVTSYNLKKNNRTVYLRLSSAAAGTFVCRSRPIVVNNQTNRNDDQRKTSISIALQEKTIAEQSGISFQSSTLAEYHVRRNGTLFIACRPEYFHFHSTKSDSFVPRAFLRRDNDSKNHELSDDVDGLLIERIDHDQSGLYICIGKLPFKDRLISAVYPIMVFVSDS